MHAGQDFALKTTGNRLQKRHPLISYRSHRMKRKWGLNENELFVTKTVALQRSLSLEERDKVVRQVFFPSARMLPELLKSEDE